MQLPPSHELRLHRKCNQNLHSQSLARPILYFLYLIYFLYFQFHAANLIFFARLAVTYPFARYHRTAPPSASATDPASNPKSHCPREPSPTISARPPFPPSTQSY